MEEIQKLKAEAFDLMLEIERVKAFQLEATNKVNAILKQIEDLKAIETKEIKGGE